MFDIQGSWEARVEAEGEGGKLSVVSPTGLIALKQLRGSLQDLADIEALTGRVRMKQVDMSAKAVTARLRQVSQLRRLCLSLQKAKLRTTEGHTSKTNTLQAETLPGANQKAK